LRNFVISRRQYFSFLNEQSIVSTDDMNLAFVLMKKKENYWGKVLFFSLKKEMETAVCISANLF
jgi:hypothetical protein